MERIFGTSVKGDKKGKNVLKWSGITLKKG